MVRAMKALSQQPLKGSLKFEKTTILYVLFEKIRVDYILLLYFQIFFSACHRSS